MTSLSDKQPEALRLADRVRPNVEAAPWVCDEIAKQDAELRRLHEENEGLKKAYWKMRNSAAGYSNYCEYNASTRICERDYTEAEDLYRAIIAKATGEGK